MFKVRTSRAWHVGGCAAVVSIAALTAAVGPAAAGGFALREQSTNFQGMSFAGDAAGGALSSMFWNSAATASLNGVNTESSYTIISPNSDVTVTKAVAGPGVPQAAFDFASPDSGNIGPAAFAGSTYGSYQLTKDIFVGMAVNAPFGLKTDPDNITYKGAVIAQKTELRTYNFNPTVAVRIAPGLTIGAGVQIQTAEGAFRFASGYPTGPTTEVEGNGWGFGGTAGIIYQMSPSTTIGVGYRSQIDQDIDGHISTAGVPIYTHATKVTLNLPDVVTASIQHEVSSKLRLAGTFEWTNWSRFKNLTVTAAGNGYDVLHPPAAGGIVAGQTVGVVPLGWSDGYFLSGGAEYDIYDNLTGRLGVAYEWSPVDSPEKRTTGFPDANRVWLSGGFSWDFTKNTTLDFAYTHIFIENGDFDRVALSGALVQGYVESKVDIISVGIKNRW